MRRPLTRWCLVLGLGASLFGPGCASSQRREAQAPARVKDSPPEKVAAQRAASGDLKLQAEEDRWGYEASQADRGERARKAAAKNRAVPAPAPAPSGQVDVQRRVPPPLETPASQR